MILVKKILECYKESYEVLVCIKNVVLTYYKYSDLIVLGYTNSNLIGYLDDDRLISKYIFTMVRKTILWKSVK